MSVRTGVALAGLLLAAAVVGPAAAAPPPLNPDLMTVSGRFGLPQAGPGAPKLAVSVAVAPEASTASAFDPAVLGPAVAQAVERSLRNHGLLAADGAAAKVSLSRVEVVREGENARVVATLSAEAPSTGCLPYAAVGRYHSLARLRSGNGRRIAGVLGTIATMGLDGGTVLARQMEWAAQENRALNSVRTTAEGEGVADAHGPDAPVRHATVNAVRLALVDLITHLNGPACSPASTVVQPPADPSTGTP